MIGHTIQWYKNFYDGVKDMYNISIDEIKQYEEFVYG
jgi:hypothetical protein